MRGLFAFMALGGCFVLFCLDHINLRKNLIFWLVLQRGGSLSSALSICHPARTMNTITYKGIKKMFPAESIYPISIVVWKSKILKAVLFQELPFKTMQCLFKEKRQRLKIWVGLKNNNIQKRIPKETFICQAHVSHFKNIGLPK